MPATKERAVKLPALMIKLDLKNGPKICILLLVVVVNGCATRKEIVNFKSDTLYLRARIDSVYVEHRRLRQAFDQFQTQNGKNTNTATRFSAETHVQLNRLIEQMQSLDDRLGDMDNRISNLSAKWRLTLASSSATTSVATMADTSSSSGFSQLAGAFRLYELAYQDLVQGHFELARQGFMQYLRLLPEGEVADFSHYWIGESYYAEKRFTEAAEAFQNLLDDFPTSSQVPKALFKLADCQLLLGETAKGKLNLQELIQRFPRTAEAQLARTRLHDLR